MTILELHETIRVSHIVVFAMVFLLLYEQRWQGGVFKVMKNDHFLVFLSVSLLSPKFFSRLINYMI